MPNQPRPGNEVVEQFRIDYRERTATDRRFHRWTQYRAAKDLESAESIVARETERMRAVGHNPEFRVMVREVTMTPWRLRCG